MVMRRRNTKILWVIINLLIRPLVIRGKYSYPRIVDPLAPDVEKEHDPTRYGTSTMSPFLGGTQDKVPDAILESPDFRMEEPVFLPYSPSFFAEEQRPYRLSPHYKAASRWHSYKNWENIHYAGCYCTTVFKRLTPLAGCAVITTRHILTTATSTHLILKDRLHFQTFEGVLGAWYDTDHNNFNSSMYLTPSRIHYHPLWHPPEMVNRSHPFSFTFDLAVWATTYNVYGWYLNGSSTRLCLRATSHSKEHGSPAPTTELFIVVGYQFMWAYNRKPMPWFKYGVRTRQYTNPCPKTDWGWFICIYGNWAKYGIESGAALHRSFEGFSWRYDGLVGMHAFSMKLRSIELNHYFTILDCHVVLDFLYNAYMSFIKPVWVDRRFNDSIGSAPKAKFYIKREYPLGVQHEDFIPPFD